MDEKMAREILELHKHLEKPMQDPVFQTELKLAIYSYKEAKGYLEGLEAGRNEALNIVKDELDNESDKGDERGNLQSIHLGAMDALRTVHEEILSLKTPMGNRGRKWK